MSLNQDNDGFPLTNSHIPIDKVQQKLPYGNMVKLFNCAQSQITIGPNYCFFSVAWSIFVITSAFVIWTVFTHSQNFRFRIISLIICLLQPFAYLITALSNPGIVFENATDLMPNMGKYCHRCQIHIKKKTFHCGQCNVCIDEYDHHCPWVSKCIGKNNIWRFYLFVGITPIYLCYSIVAMTICSAGVQQTILKL